MLGELLMYLVCIWSVDTVKPQALYTDILQGLESQLARLPSL